MHESTCMKKQWLIYSFLFCLFGKGGIATGQTLPWYLQMSDFVLERWKDSMALKPGRPAEWSYEQGVVLNALEQVWRQTGDGKYFHYIQHAVDFFVNDDGNIRTYRMDEYNLDQLCMGRSLLMLYNVTGKKKYKLAANLLRRQLKTQPRTLSGGFWHKQRYPSQMWLDGLYMAGPFYAAYAQVFQEPAAFEDVALQFQLMWKHAHDPHTGLLYHGWDESRQQQWADPVKGHSPSFWGRAMGWYLMGLVDVLDYFPAGHSQRKALLAILTKLATALKQFQDPRTGLWYQLIDKQGTKGNYPEASASCMFIYALAKSVRKGYLSASYAAIAQKAYQGVLKNFVSTDAKGKPVLNGICSVAGLGGDPYRDGSIAYYLSEKVVANDPKGMAAFILAGREMALAPEAGRGKGKTVLLDYYFNHEYKTLATGQLVRYHYTWEDQTDNGFSWLGDIFENYGVKKASLEVAPSPSALQKADIYIIVDPDTDEETKRPHFIAPADAKAIADWVQQGGVLVLLANDSGNVEMDHLNQLAAQFGIQFNHDSRNRVKGNDFAKGALQIDQGNPIFKTSHQIYIKELSTLSLQQPALPVLTADRAVIMAVAKYGKGTVFALGDPWVYNEYLDGRRLPANYQNFPAAREWIDWLIKQCKQ